MARCRAMTWSIVATGGPSRGSAEADGGPRPASCPTTATLTGAVATMALSLADRLRPAMGCFPYPVGSDASAPAVGGGVAGRAVQLVDEGRRLDAGAHAQLGQDAGHVDADRLLADE